MQVPRVMVARIRIKVEVLPPLFGEPEELTPLQDL